MPQLLDQVKTSMMEQFIAMGKGKKLKESRGQKMDEDFNTDRDIFKGHSTSFMYTEDKEFAKVFDTTFEFSEDENFNRLINNSSFDYKEGTEIDKEFGDISREVLTNGLERDQHMFHKERLKQEEEFAKIFYTTAFKFHEDDEFDRLFDNIPNEQDDDERFAKTFANGTSDDKFKQDLDIKGVKCPVLRGGCKQGEFDEFVKEWSQYAEYQWEMDSRELRQQLMNCVVGPMEMIMYNSLGSKLDSLSEPDLLKELEKLAVVRRIAEQQDVEAVVCVNNQAVVNMEDMPSLQIPAHQLTVDLHRDILITAATINLSMRKIPMTKSWLNKIKKTSKLWQQKTKTWQQKTKLWQQKSSKWWQQKTKTWQQKTKLWQQQSSKLWQQKTKTWQQKTKPWKQSSQLWQKTTRLYKQNQQLASTLPTWGGGYHQGLQEETKHN
jgi:hypothetical protein